MKRLLLILIFISSTSCTLISPKIALKRAGIFNTKSELKIIENEDQKVVFIGMHHFGRKEFYDDVAKKVDSLQKLNFIVFYEGVTRDKKIDSIVTIQNFKKFRKLMGFFPIEYLDTTNNQIQGKIKYVGKYKLVNQPEYSKLKVDSLTSVKGDVSMNELINEFERYNGEIKLDSCDLKSNLTEKIYKCKKVDKILSKEFKMNYIKDFREKTLAQIISKSNEEKVLVIYGDSHFWGLYNELNALGKRYKLKKYKKFIPQ